MTTAHDDRLAQAFAHLVTDSDRDWTADALCAQTNPDDFFPDKGGSTREAKQACHYCPVRQECLDYALANNERFGIWGGKSERERRAIATPRKAAS